MAVATVIELTEDERTTLESLVRATSTEQRFVQRARIVLECATGSTTKCAAYPPCHGQQLAHLVRQAQIEGAADTPRPGKSRVYGEETERRILALLDEPPPNWYTTWTETSSTTLSNSMTW